MVSKDKKYGFSTIPIHMGTEGKDTTSHHPVNSPIYASSTFAFPTVDHGAKIFSGEDTEGFVYGRLANPTIVDTEMRIANLEGAEDAALFGSGMAAVTTLVTSILHSGDHVIADKTLYGGSHSVFSHILPGMGIEVTRLDASVIEDVKAAIKPNTKLIYFENVTNPTLRVVPIKPIVALAREHGILTAIDATFMSPILLRSIELGVDLVLHSATKYLNGHSDLIAGVISGSKELIGAIKMQRVHFGGMTSPFDAYLLGRGLKTLKIRIDAHEKNGRIVADYLRSHPMVKTLNYIGHEDNPGYQTIKEECLGFGSMMTFELNGTFDMAKTFVDELKLITRAVSLGGVETLISHPASTTHSDLVVTPEERAEAGITDTLMRLSVGIEDAEDIVHDLEQAFDKIKNKVEVSAD